MDAVAEFFWKIRSGKLAPAAIPDKFVPVSLADGYRAQAALVDRILAGTADGDNAPIGYKVACTSEFARNVFSVDGPVFGRLLSSLSWSDGAELSAADFPMTAVEPEFAFQMSKDVPDCPNRWTKDTIAEFVGLMMPAIELVGHSFPDWSAYSGPTLAADNAVHLGWIHGAKTAAWKTVDLADHRVTLRVNGEQRLDGSGANVMGHPLNAVAWLACVLPMHGLRLRRGDMVTTGVCTEIFQSGPGECVRADFGSLGTVSVAFTE